MTKVQTLFTRFKGNNTTLSGVSSDRPSQMNRSQYTDQDQIRIRGGSHCPHTARPAKTFAPCLQNTAIILVCSPFYPQAPLIQLAQQKHKHLTTSVLTAEYISAILMIGLCTL